MSFDNRRKKLMNPITKRRLLFRASVLTGLVVVTAALSAYAAYLDGLCGIPFGLSFLVSIRLYGKFYPFLMDAKGRELILARLNSKSHEEETKQRCIKYLAEVEVMQRKMTTLDRDRLIAWFDGEADRLKKRQIENDFKSAYKPAYEEMVLNGAIKDSGKDPDGLVF